MPEISLKIVQTKEEDAKCIMEWRNDPQTLQYSYHRQPKIWPQFWGEFQRDYFNSSDPPSLFILDSGQPFAFLRYQQVPDPRFLGMMCCNVSINLAPEMRGKGLGALALRCGNSFIQAQKKQAILAEIRIENRASAIVFEKAGFVLLDQTMKHIADTGESCPIYRYILESP